MNEEKSVELLGERLRTAREHSGLSQGQVAKMLGFHRPTVSEIEAGRRKVSADEVVAFARIYDVNVSWLLQDDQQGNASSPRIELAARELAKLKDDDLDRLLGLLAALREQEENADE